MEDKLGMVYDRDLWDTTSDYYDTATGKIETKIDQQLLQVSNDDFLMSEVQYFESNGQQVAENQNTDSVIRAKIGFIYRTESEVLTATQEERAKTALLDHLPGNDLDFFLESEIWLTLVSDRQAHIKLTICFEKFHSKSMTKVF